MYAVVSTGGKQYRVQVGDTIDVEKMPPAANGTVELRPLLVVDDGGKVNVGRQALAKAKVKAHVVDQRKGPKITVFKYKNKTGYRRKAGHRQDLTRVQVDEITV